MQTGDKVVFPEHFRGIFERNRERHSPLLAEAREELRALDVPSFLRPNYEYAVLGNAQPSFMLLPMLYLAMAEHAGGATERHRRYLPAHMLAMELVAVLDDTVDRTPFRSGRPTYANHFGECSATPFCCFLLNAVLARTAAVAPELFPLVTDLFGPLCALQTWEFHARYPDPTADACAEWLQHHYDAVTPAVSHSLDSALRLHGVEAVPREVCVRFGEIMQDVDDVVNLVEQREQAGENDDLKMGIVTYPLLHVVRHDPSTQALARTIWKRYEVTSRAPRGELDEAMKRCDAEVARDFQTLSMAMVDVGVPAAVRKIVADAEACVAASPVALRPCVEDMVLTFVDRLRRMPGSHAALLAA